MPTAISIDLRERILESVDKKEGTQQEIADRYKVSHGMVKKLVSQRKHLGDISPQYKNCGRPAIITGELRGKLRSIVEEHPDFTLEEIRNELGVECTVQAIFYVLKDMGLSYKKRLSGPVSRIVRT